MACCALAAFIVSQLLVALDWLRERVLGRAPAPVALNANAAWRPGDAVSLAAPRAFFGAPRRAALALSGTAFALALAALAIEAGAARQPSGLRIPYLCTSEVPGALD